MNKYLIILSGGIGSRFESNQPKQYFKAENGERIFKLSVKPFANKNFDRVVVVADKNYHNIIEEDLSSLNFLNIKFAKAGSTRQDSIDNAIKELTNDGNRSGQIFIQEAVRPFVDSKIVKEIIDADKKHLTVSPGVNPPVLYSNFNYENKSANNLIPKSEIIELQLPKRHDLEKYLELRKKTKLSPSDFLDESQLFTEDGIDIHVTKGSYENIKITYPSHRFLLDATMRGKDE